MERISGTGPLKSGHSPPGALCLPGAQQSCCAQCSPPQLERPCNPIGLYQSACSFTGEQLNPWDVLPPQVAMHVNPYCLKGGYAASFTY